LRDLIIKNGLHWHGLAMVNPLAPKLFEMLDFHINQNRSKYMVGSIRKIGSEPITHDPVYATGYGMKGLKRRSFFEDDVLLFPRAVSELPSNGPVGPLARSPCMIFNARKKDLLPISLRGTDKAVQICTAFIFVQKKMKKL
jgi:hypothetical protein